MLRLQLSEETKFEKQTVIVHADARSLSHSVALTIADLIRSKQQRNELVVLGLATGRTPMQVYAELVRLHRHENLSFENVVSFNLDEYYGLSAGDPSSYACFMQQHLFSLVDMDPSHVFIPDGMIRPEALEEYCLEYERRIQSFGGIDLQLAGIGRNGHLGFNEPGSSWSAGTRLVSLHPTTRTDAAKDFGSLTKVPLKAITMGIGTILQARQILVIATGVHKSQILRTVVEGCASPEVPATCLQGSTKALVHVDSEAACLLTRFRAPWLVKDCQWNDKLMKKAIIWLSEKLGKPVLQLTGDDYQNNGLAQLEGEKGTVDELNKYVFTQLQRTVTGWPGAKLEGDATAFPEVPVPERKRIILFSPHPDDDVISMGGTFIRLVEQGHEVHVVYQTSGNTAVWDDDVVRYLEFVVDFMENLDREQADLTPLYNQVRTFVRTREERQPDMPLIRNIKGLIRKGEAIAGARFVGLDDEHIHFMNLDFYDQLKIHPVFDLESDIISTMALLDKIKPHLIFTAGDFADPHGTHKICFDIVREAFGRSHDSFWSGDCLIWLYRGAWQEFDIHEIEMAVPLSPQEIEKKRLAIFKHQSQKDRPVFPGNDPREFWLRAEERTRLTAKAYDQLGLPAYAAIEAFVQWRN